MVQKFTPSDIEELLGIKWDAIYTWVGGMGVDEIKDALDNTWPDEDNRALAAVLVGISAEMPHPRTEWTVEIDN